MICFCLCVDNRVWNHQSFKIVLQFWSASKSCGWHATDSIETLMSYTPLVTECSPFFKCCHNNYRHWIIFHCFPRSLRLLRFGQVRVQLWEFCVVLWRKKPFYQLVSHPSERDLRKPFWGQRTMVRIKLLHTQSGNVRVVESGVTIQGHCSFYGTGVGWGDLGRGNLNALCCQ